MAHINIKSNITLENPKKKKGKYLTTHCISFWEEATHRV